MLREAHSAGGIWLLTQPRSGASVSRCAHVYFVIGNCVPYDTKASGGRRTPRRGIWLLTQPRSGASVRQAHTFLTGKGKEALWEKSLNCTALTI